MAGMGPAATRAEIMTSVAAASTPELAARLLEEFEELTRRFHLGDFRPSELSGGRFCEAAFRICQQVCLGKHAPLNRMLPNTDQLVRELENVDGAKADATYRVHIPRTLRLIYDLRNKRDVAHLGAVSPNFTDASLILGTTSWIVAEIVRLSHRCDIAKAQQIVDGLVQRRVPLIWADGDFVRVLKPSLSYGDKVLVILHRFSLEWVADSDLIRWLDYPRAASEFKKRVLRTLHDKALIQYSDGKCKVLPPGLKYVEESPDLRQL